jgi:hypothetical protein
VGLQGAWTDQVLALMTTAAIAVGSSGDIMCTNGLLPPDAGV